MKIGEIIKQYRNEHGYSLREFAKLSGVSNSYISMLESGKHPRSGRPIVPTLTKLNQIADAMGLRVDDLISAMDDTPVKIDDGGGFYVSPLEKQIILRFRALPDGERNMLLRSLGLGEKGDKSRGASIPYTG
jgi:transcriptional regulator with XRE-family HTH domain